MRPRLAAPATRPARATTYRVSPPHPRGGPAHAGSRACVLACACSSVAGPDGHYEWCAVANAPEWRAAHPVCAHLVARGSLPRAPTAHRCAHRAACYVAHPAAHLDARRDAGGRGAGSHHPLHGGQPRAKPSRANTVGVDSVAPARQRFDPGVRCPLPLPPFPPSPISPPSLPHLSPVSPSSPPPLSPAPLPSPSHLSPTPLPSLSHLSPISLPTPSALSALPLPPRARESRSAPCLASRRHCAHPVSLPWPWPWSRPVPHRCRWGPSISFSGGGGAPGQSGPY